ncbi:MAG: hypothetical protein EOP56_04900 [Sphingobacteriales bacterium]|nr:MAG: hypothetical protein EOP56_04900 [Sphingobacteriales bacterium]
MDTTLLFELPVAGKDIKALVNRHCMKNTVFYSVELMEESHTTACHFMAYDTVEWMYKFIGDTTPIALLEKEEEFSEFIFRSFHDYCLS